MRQLSSIIFVILFSLGIVIELYCQCDVRENDPINFNWRDSHYTFYLTYPGSSMPITTIVESPWFAAYSNNPNINHFRLQNPKDFEPEDGWLLLQYDFGTPTRAINHPYFILYNKFSGLLRIFVAISTVIDSHNSAIISLHYAENSRRSAVLEFNSLQAYQNTLSEFDNNVPKREVGNNYDFNLPYWLHADFQMNYDPCSCNYFSQLVFDVRLVTSSNLTFSINGNAIQDMDNLGRRGSGKQSLAKLTQSVVDAGTSYYKSANSALNMLEQVFPNFTLAENPIFNIVPGLGAAIGITDKLIAIFSSDKPAEVKPLVFDVKLSADGEINYDGFHRTTVFETPGSDNLTMVPPTTLSYNNILGVMTLLEPPKINQYYGEYSVISEEPWGTEISGEGYLRVELAEDIKYVINPAAGFDMDISEIYGSFIFEGCSTDPFGERSNMTAISNSVLVSRSVPLGCLPNYSANVGYSFVTGSYMYNYDYRCMPQIYFKLNAILRKQDLNGVLHETLFSVKYKPVLNQSFSEHYNGYLQTLDTFFDLIPYDIVLEDLNYSTNTTIQAWNKVEIGNNVTVSNGTQLTIKAGKEIVVKPGAILPPEVALKIESPTGCERIVQQTNPQPYCSNSNYIAKVNQYYLRVDNYEEEEDKDRIDKILLRAYPNPTSSTVTFQYTLAESTEIHLVLMDLNGRVVQQLDTGYKSQGRHEVVYDIYALPSGIYLYRLQKGKINETKRLVVIK